jgi:hypothetical protein
MKILPSDEILGGGLRKEAMSRRATCRLVAVTIEHHPSPQLTPFTFF